MSAPVSSAVTAAATMRVIVMAVRAAAAVGMVVVTMRTVAARPVGRCARTVIVVPVAQS